MEPKIRLKGFSGEWEYKKLSSLTSVRGGYAFQSSLFQKSGVPVVRISNILSNGNVGGDFAYYPKLDGDSNVTLHDKDVVIAMSGATTGKIARVDIGDGVLYQNQRVGLFTKTGKVDYDFLYAVLNRPHFNELLNKLLTSSAQPNASSADIESIEMGFPIDSEEQKALSNYVLSLDSLIQSTTKKIESLKQVKAASLQSMFPQEGETTPRVRFKGFEGEWEKVSLKKYAKRINRKNKNMESTLALTISSIEGLVSQIDYFNNLVVGANLANYYLLKNGEFAYNKSYSRGYPFGSVKRLDRYDQGILSTLYIVFSVNDEISSDYLARFFDTTLWHKPVAERAEEGARNHGLLNIGADDFMTIDIVVPTSRNEQQQIADFFTNLDSQITLQTQRLEKLKQIKSACLDNMFV